MSVFVTLAPLDLCGLPEWVLSEHQYAIVDGVLESFSELPGELPAERRRGALDAVRLGQGPGTDAGHRRLQPGVGADHSAVLRAREPTMIGMRV